MITQVRTHQTPVFALPRHALHAAILIGLMAPAIVLAQDEYSLDEPTKPAADPEAIAELTEIRSVVEFGLGYVDDDSFRFGRYNGLRQQGGYGVLNIDWYRRAARDSDDPMYTRVTAENLGLTTRQMRIEHGRQGDYRLWLDAHQLPMYRSDSASTIFDGVGGTHLTLPSDWVGATNTAGMSRLQANLTPVEISHDRRRVELGLDKLLTPQWDVSTSFRHESKQGLKTIGAVIGNSGGNPRAVILPEPVDYETREADIALRYTDPHKQLELRYLVSLFDDANSALSWQNPYTTISGWQASAGFPGGFGQLSLPPDNQFHQGSVAAGYSWDSGLRLTADFALGRMTQDETFLPYTINPVLAASITQPLPRSSLDGEIDTTVANIRLGDRPTPNFHWNATLRYDDRDNKTPRDEYVYIGGDSNTQNTAVNSATRRYNEPYSFRETRMKIDAGYRFGSRTSLTGAVEERDTERTYSERESADETSYTLNLRHALSDWFSGTLQVARADRSGSTYHGNEPFLSGYAPGYTSTVPGQFENAPGLRRYFLADRIRDRNGINLMLTPNEFWNIGLDVQRLVDDYRESELGLTASESDVFAIDIAYLPSPRWTNYVFLSREKMALDQDGVSTRGGTRVEDAVNPARMWTARHRDDIDSAGIGFNWEAIENRLDLGADGIYSRSTSHISVVTGSALTSAPLPDDHADLDSVSLHAKYRLGDKLSLIGRVWNERYRSSDIALDGVEANQLANVILLGDLSPDYNVTAITVSLAYTF